MSEQSNERVSDELVEKLAVSIFDMDSDNDTVAWERQPGRVRTRTRRTVRSVLNAIAIHAPELQQRRASVPVTSQDLLHAVLSLPHEITGSEIILRAAPNKLGNATAQLHSALTAALPVSHKTAPARTVYVAVDHTGCIHSDEDMERVISIAKANEASVKQAAVSHETGDGECKTCLGTATVEDPATTGHPSFGFLPCPDCIPAPTDETQGVKQEPVVWISEATSDDLANDRPWVSGAFGEFSQRKRDTHPIPLFSLSQLEAVERERDEALDHDWVARSAYETAISEAYGFRTRAASAEASLADMTKALEYAGKGLGMVHDGLMDPTRPRQAVGEVCSHFLDAARTAISAGAPS